MQSPVSESMVCVGMKIPTVLSFTVISLKTRDEAYGTTEKGQEGCFFSLLIFCLAIDLINYFCDQQQMTS